MRPSRLLVIVAAGLPVVLAFACSSSSSPAPAAAAAGAAGASGAAGAGGDTSGTGGTSSGGSDTGGTGDTGAGAGPTGAGAGSTFCKSSGDAAIFGITHPQCQPCAVGSCDQEYTDAYGPLWSMGDLSKGGVCQQFETCSVDKCGCAPTCVAKTCMPSLSTQCQMARDAVQACLGASCNLPCGLPPLDDGGMLGASSARPALQLGRSVKRTIGILRSVFF